MSGIRHFVHLDNGPLEPLKGTGGKWSQRNNDISYLHIVTGITYDKQHSIINTVSLVCNLLELEDFFRLNFSPISLSFLKLEGKKRIEVKISLFSGLIFHGKPIHLLRRRKIETFDAFSVRIHVALSG